jgi:hypothetical protein
MIVPSHVELIVGLKEEGEAGAVHRGDVVSHNAGYVDALSSRES